MVSVLDAIFLTRIIAIFCQFRACSATVIIVLAFSAAVVFRAPASASEHYFNAGGQADSDRLHAVLAEAAGDVSLTDLQADAALIDPFYTNGFVPAIVRLTGSELPAGFFSDTQSLRSESKAVVQNGVSFGLVAHTAANESSVHTGPFSMIPDTAVQVTDDELEPRLGRPNAIGIVEEEPGPPVLQDNNYFGVTQDASIIAVQVATLFKDGTGGGGDLDLYVGVNSLFDEDYEQKYGLLQGGQSFIAGITWTF